MGVSFALFVAGRRPRPMSKLLSQRARGGDSPLEGKASVVSPWFTMCHSGDGSKPIFTATFVEDPVALTWGGPGGPVVARLLTQPPRNRIILAHKNWGVG